MKLQVYVYICLCMCSWSMNAQDKSCTCCIKGTVLDTETKKPIPYATVNVESTEKFVQTNKDGDFVIEDMCPENYTLVISCLGYSESSQEHHHEPNDHRHFYLIKDITGLDEVLIKAERAKEKGTETISQLTLSKAELQNIPTQSLGASLAQVEGVTFASTGSNIQLPVIHGLSGNRILILNNGIKHAFQNWGMDHAPEINLNAAHNITVIKGAAGVRFGPEAISGAVLVKPNPLLLNDPFYANLGTSFETNGRGVNTNIELGKGGENWSYFINGSYTRIGDRNAPDFNLTNSGKEERAFGFGALYHIDNLDFNVHYSYVDQDLAVLRASFATSPDAFINAINTDRPLIIDPFSYDINEPNQVLQHQLAKAELDWYYSGEGKLSLTGGVQLNRRDEFDVRRNSYLPIIELDLFTLDYELEWEHPLWKGIDGSIGVQYFSQNNDNNPGTQTTPFIPNYNTDRYSAYVIEKVKFGENTFEAGARFDIETNDVRGRETNQDIFRDRYTFTNFTASLGYQWKLSENSDFKTNIGSAFRTPNVAELFSFGQQGFRSVFGLLRITNSNGQLSTNDVTLLDESDVDLERGYKLTTEFRTTSNGNSHLITGYANYIDNYVFDRPIGVFGTIRGPQATFIVDQAEALFLGVDYTWKRELTQQLSASYGLSYLWARNIGENEPLIDIPPISTNLQLDWNQGEWWVFDSSKWTLKPNYTFRQFQAPRAISPESLADGTTVITPDSEIFDFLEAPEGYFLFDLSWNFKWNSFRGSVTVQNLFDTSYRSYLNELRYFADEPGRNILVALNYNL